MKLPKPLRNARAGFPRAAPTRGSEAFFHAPPLWLRDMSILSQRPWKDDEIPQYLTDSSG